MQSRNYYLNKFRKKREPADWDVFRELRNVVKKRLRDDKQSYFESLCKEIGAKLKRVWNELNVALGRKINRKKISLDIGSETIQCARAIATHLNQHFVSPCSSPLPHMASPPLVNSTLNIFKFRPLEEEEVLSALQGLDTCKATGADKISVRLLKSTAPVISMSVTKLFNQCIATGKTPDEWKEANITPIPKSPSATLPPQFRPISVLPVIAKVYESLIHKQLYSYLVNKSLLHPCQSGFRPDHGTQDVLLKTVDDWRKALDLGKCIGTVFVDLSKAFDSIDHSVLLSKLKSFGIKGMEFDWFCDYLSRHKQRVVVDGHSSEWAHVTQGVPQGSILGPLLFLIYVNDLPAVVAECTVSLYADDVTIYYANKDEGI